MFTVAAGEVRRHQPGQPDVTLQRHDILRMTVSGRYSSLILETSSRSLVVPLQWLENPGGLLCELQQMGLPERTVPVWARYASTAGAVAIVALLLVGARLFAPGWRPAAAVIALSLLLCLTLILARRARRLHRGFL